MHDPSSATPPESERWRLRLVAVADIDGLHGLTSQPLVYRYLFDGAAPDRATIASGVAASMVYAATTGLGMWVLETPFASCAGGILLRPDLAARSAELTYFLDPALWGRGLATRMAWTAIGQAFHNKIDVVEAGADAANTASLKVMRRLGMRFVRNVSYPLGPGALYALARGDLGPEVPPATLPMSEKDRVRPAV